MADGDATFNLLYEYNYQYLDDSQRLLLDETETEDLGHTLHSSDEQNSEEETSRDQHDHGVLSVKRARVESSNTKFTRKYQGAALYKSKYQNEWHKKWPCITPLKDKRNYFYCTVCGKAVSCGHQGEKDVRRHMESELHKKNVESVKHTTPLKFIPSNLKKKVLFYI